MSNSWYGWLERKDAMQVYRYPGEGPAKNYVAREWPLGWLAIDGDEVILEEGEPVDEPIEGEDLAEDETEDSTVQPKVGDH